jgi:glycosyltransferase involved in cell wall biosynthesis
MAETHLISSTPNSKEMPTIIGIPFGPDSYTTTYYDALQRNGVRVLKGHFAGRWLLAHRRGVDYLHLNWPSFLYAGQSAMRSLYGFARFIVLLLLTRLCGIRLLWTAHNLYPHDRNRIALLDWLARKIVVSLSSRVFVHGESAALVVKREFPGTRKKLTIIPHGNWIGFYPDGCSRMAARTRLKLSPDRYVFLTLGLCKPYKNLEYLIKCFQDGPFDDAILWIVGLFQQPEYRAAVMAQIERQPERIRYEGRHVPDDELQYYFSACDAVVLPYAEVLTSGNAMLAMSFGRPVIAPRLGHLQDVINGACGMLYDPSVPEGLSGAMQRVRQRRFDDSVIRQHVGRFQWQDAAEKTIGVLGFK